MVVARLLPVRMSRTTSLKFGELLELQRRSRKKRMRLASHWHRQPEKTSLSTCALAVKVQITTTTDSQLSNGFLIERRRVQESSGLTSCMETTDCWVFLCRSHNVVSLKPHLHEQKDRHGTPREVVSAPLRFRTPVPYYFWARYVYTFKIRSAVPKNLATPYRNFGVPCRSFCSCEWVLNNHRLSEQN